MPGDRDRLEKIQLVTQTKLVHYLEGTNKPLGALGPALEVVALAVLELALTLPRGVRGADAGLRRRRGPVSPP